MFVVGLLDIVGVGTGGGLDLGVMLLERCLISRLALFVRVVKLARPIVERTGLDDRLVAEVGVGLCALVKLGLGVARFNDRRLVALCARSISAGLNTESCQRLRTRASDIGDVFGEGVEAMGEAERLFDGEVEGAVQAGAGVEAVDVIEGDLASVDAVLWTSS